MSPPSWTALTSPPRSEGARATHDKTAVTVSYGSRLTPSAGPAQAPVETWASIPASRVPVATASAASRASSAATPSNRPGSAPSSAHDAHAAITHAATSAAGSAWVARDSSIAACRRRPAWLCGNTQPIGSARIAAPFVARPEDTTSPPRRNCSIAAVVVGPRPLITGSCPASSARWHPTKVTRIETGQWTRLNLRDVRDLLDIYGVTDEAQREALIQLARDARQRGWWHSYGDVLPSEYSHFIGLEADAASVRTFQHVLVPGLLQTEGYARAVIQAFRPSDNAEGIDRRVDVRHERQRRVTEERSLQLSAVLGEGVVHQLVGGREVTAEQLRFLAHANDLPNVMVQVLPYAAGAHVAMVGSFEILGFPEPVDPDVVYLENMASALFLEEPDEITRYVQVFDYLRAAALSPQASGDMLTRAAEELA